jgi:hypothetical protein
MPASEQTVNPYQIVSYKTQSVLGLVYETMLTLDAQGNPQPGLCESWQVQQDGSVLFSVRKNVTFLTEKRYGPAHGRRADLYPRHSAAGRLRRRAVLCAFLALVARWSGVDSGAAQRRLYPMLCALTVPIADLGKRSAAPALTGLPVLPQGRDDTCAL